MPATSHDVLVRNQAIMGPRQTNVHEDLPNLRTAKRGDLTESLGRGATRRHNIHRTLLTSRLEGHLAASDPPKLAGQLMVGTNNMYGNEERLRFVRMRTSCTSFIQGKSDESHSTRNGAFSET
jgi:hypothetical protein